MGCALGLGVWVLGLVFEGKRLCLKRACKAWKRDS